jgi:hypothetical protein
MGSGGWKGVEKEEKRATRLTLPIQALCQPRFFAFAHFSINIYNSTSYHFSHCIHIDQPG